MTLHLFVEGVVQGVGFRQYVRYKANKLNVKGWVKNLPDKRVEIVLNGDQENLRKLVKIIKRGPFLAQVKSVEIKELHNEQLFSTFDIIKP